jgi:hypothetical protein
MSIFTKLTQKTLLILAITTPTQTFAQYYNQYGTQNSYNSAPQQSNPYGPYGPGGYYSAQNNFGVSQPPRQQQCTLTPTGGGAYIQRCW